MKTIIISAIALLLLPVVAQAQKKAEVPESEQVAVEIASTEMPEREIADSLIDYYTSLLEKNPPDDFVRNNRGAYVKETEEGTIVLRTLEGIVKQVVVGTSVGQSGEAASMYLRKFYDYFEDNWDYNGVEGGKEAYSQNGIRVIFFHSEKGDDGQIVACILFMKI